MYVIDESIMSKKGTNMKRVICFLFLGVIILTGTFALTNEEYVRNIALLVRRWNDWNTRCNSYWASRLDKDNKYSGSGSYEDYVCQIGAYHGIARALSEAIDECISLHFTLTMPEQYSWLTEKNSDYFYNVSQKGSWYNGLTTDRKKIYNFGYFYRHLEVMEGKSARFPNIWEWIYFGD
jgi:hypothetical protein